MIDLVAGAFLAARVADLRTELANPLGKSGASRHLGRGEPAGVGATSIKFNAAHHHLDIFLVQTSRGAVFAYHRAFLTGFDAIAEFLV